MHGASGFPTRSDTNRAVTVQLICGFVFAYTKEGFLAMRLIIDRHLVYIGARHNAFCAIALSGICQAMVIWLYDEIGTLAKGLAFNQKLILSRKKVIENNDIKPKISPDISYEPR